MFSHVRLGEFHSNGKHSNGEYDPGEFQSDDGSPIDSTTKQEKIRKVEIYMV